MTIAVCELRSAWQEGLGVLQERRHRLLSLSKCCDPDEAKQQLSPNHQQEVGDLEDRIAAYQGDAVFQAVWTAVLPTAAAPSETFPSQRAKQPAAELTPYELKIAIVWYRLRRAGITNPKATDYQR
jgi:hypothetical protein